MGYVGYLQCGKCGFRMEVKFGIGDDLVTGIESLIAHNILPKKWHGQVRQVLKEGQVSAVNYYFTVYQCHQCKDLSNNLHLRIDYQTAGGQLRNFQTEYFCRKCRRPIVPVTGAHPLMDENEEGETRIIANIQCPKCGSNAMGFTLKILFD